MRRDKQTVVEMLKRSDFEGIIGLKREGIPVFRILQGLSYDKSDLVCWRSIEAVGHLSASMAQEEPGAVRNMVRRLVWTLSDECGGMAWSAPEMLAEMAARNPVLCSDIPLIVVHLDEPPFRFGATWAAGRLAETHRKDVLTAVPELLEALVHDDPMVRGAAAWALGRLGCREAEALLRKSFDDPAQILLYRDGELHGCSVGALARDATDRIRDLFGDRAE